MLNKRLSKFVILLSLLSIFSCEEKSNKSNNIIEIKLLTLKFEDISIQPIQTNTLFSRIEYIFLETLPECLLNEDEIEISVTKKFIIANNKYYGGNYLFERKTGKFLYEI